MENTPNTLDELITLLEQTRTDYNKFYNGYAKEKYI